MGAQVTLDLKEFDELRNDLRDLKLLRNKLIRKIYDAKEGTKEDKPNLTVFIKEADFKEIIKLLLEMDVNYDWMPFEFKDEEIEVEIIKESN